MKIRDGTATRKPLVRASAILLFTVGTGKFLDAYFTWTHTSATDAVDVALPYFGLGAVILAVGCVSTIRSDG